jgi:8-oxo-dGTP pyrophosphatase MutT (NUDIX family)
MKEEKEAIFNVGQKAFIKKDGKVLVMWNKYGLDFPGGRIMETEIMGKNRNESLVESLKREVIEETGLEIEVGEPFAVWFYKRKKTVFLVGYECKYVSGEIIISDEHYKYKWVDKNNYKDVDVGENSDYFEALEKYFNKYAN